MAVDRLLFSVIDRLVDGDLTADGVQFSDIITTAAINTDVVVLSRTLGHGMAGSLLTIEFGLTAEFRAVSSLTADLIWVWQARNVLGTWVNLHPAVTETNIGTAWLSRSRSGFRFAVANLNVIPFEIRLLLQCNELNQGQGRVRGSSSVTSAYSVPV